MSEEKTTKQEEKTSAANNAEEKHSDTTVVEQDATVVESLGDLNAVEEKDNAEPAKKKVVSKEFIAAKGNSLCAAASTLLNIAAELRRPHTNVDLAKLRQSLTIEINAFNLKAKNKNIDDNQITLARYILCAMLDEFVLDTPWGANSNWSEYSLLNTFHQDSSGGAKFFAILEKMQQSPALNLPLLELLYLCLCLGYLGKYRITTGGKEQLVSIKQQLFQQIEAQRKGIKTSLWSVPEPVDAKKVNKVKRVPFLKLSIITIVSLVVIFSIFKVTINSKANNTIEQLRTIVVENTVTGDGSRVAK